MIKRAAMRRREREAAWSAAARDDEKWQNRLKRAAYSGLIGTFVMFLLVLGTAFPWLYPRDLEGLGILFCASVVLAACFFVGFYVQEWIEDRRERYWLWRSTSVLASLVIAGGMLYGVFATADYWLPHFR